MGEALTKGDSPNTLTKILRSSAPMAVANAASGMYSDYTGLQKHRAEHQRYYNEVTHGPKPQQYGFINLSRVNNILVENPGSESNPGRNIAIGVGASAVTAAVVGVAYCLGMSHQRKKEEEMRALKAEQDAAADEQRLQAILERIRLTRAEQENNEP